MNLLDNPQIRDLVNYAKGNELIPSHLLKTITFALIIYSVPFLFFRIKIIIRLLSTIILASIHNWSIK